MEKNPVSSCLWLSSDSNSAQCEKKGGETNKCKGKNQNYSTPANQK